MSCSGSVSPTSAPSSSARSAAVAAPAAAVACSVARAVARSCSASWWALPFSMRAAHVEQLAGGGAGGLLGGDQLAEGALELVDRAFGLGPEDTELLGDRGDGGRQGGGGVGGRLLGLLERGDVDLGVARDHGRLGVLGAAAHRAGGSGPEGGGQAGRGAGDEGGQDLGQALLGAGVVGAEAIDVGLQGVEGAAPTQQVGGGGDAAGQLGDSGGLGLELLHPGGEVVAQLVGAGLVGGMVDELGLDRGLGRRGPLVGGPGVDELGDLGRGALEAVDGDAQQAVGGIGIDVLAGDGETGRAQDLAGARRARPSPLDRPRSAGRWRGRPPRPGPRPGRRGGRRRRPAASGRPRPGPR